MEELQKIGFWGRRKGRSQVIPVQISELLTIQKLVSQGEEILKIITLSYINSKREIEEINQKFFSLNKNDEIEKFYNFASNLLLKIYDMETEINNCKTFGELFQMFNQKKIILNIFPAQYFLSMKAIYEVNSLSPGTKSGEEIVAIFEKFSQFSGDLLLLKDHFSEFIKKLGELEFKYIKKDLNGEEKAINIEEGKTQEEIITYTIRTQDGLLIIYLKESAIEKIKKLIEGISESFLRKEELSKKIKESKIEGIKKIEIFEKFEKQKEKKISSTTLRSAILGNLLPIVEGLEREKAEKILKAFGWEVYFLDDEKEIKNKLNEFLKMEEIKFVILTGLNSESKIFWGSW
jgi:hypothetical protein